MALSSFAPGKATLYAIGNEAEPKEYALSASECVIGRLSLCDIVLQRDDVSRVHARIKWQGQFFVLIDAGSINGTYVNGQKIAEPHRLRNNDGIGLANRAVVLQFVDHDATSVVTPSLQFISREQRFMYRNTPLNLSPNLTRLLLHLYTNAGEVCPHKSCIQAIWKDTNFASVDITEFFPLLHKEISELREKFQAIDPKQKVIKTHRGIGYYLDLE